MVTHACNWCQKPTTTRCGGCRRVSYCSPTCQGKDWKEGGHKILCRDLKKAIEKAEPLIDTSNPLPNVADGFGVIESPEEEQAQDLCYNAMEVSDNRLPEKMKFVIKALKVFPLSTEAWGMLGAFYRYYLPGDQHDYEQSVRMYNNAIRCARKLNPTWTENRREKLEWGRVETRPYLRALLGRAIARKELGNTTEAIREAKKLLKWNPSDNQGARNLLCCWLLEAGDTESCLNLIMDYKDVSYNTPLAYSNLLLQFLRWQKEEILEESVQEALCAALKTNLYVPDMLLLDRIEKQKIEYLDSKGPKDAHSYAQNAHSVWRAHGNALEWLSSQKSTQNDAIPRDWQLIRLLRTKMDILVRCEHTALDGTDKKTSVLHATQRRDNCIGRGCGNFYWPAKLDQEYSSGEPILLHRNDLFSDDLPRGNSRAHWRMTNQEGIVEVPFWKVLLQGVEEGWEIFG